MMNDCRFNKYSIWVFGFVYSKLSSCRSPCGIHVQTDLHSSQHWWMLILFYAGCSYIYLSIICNFNSIYSSIFCTLHISIKYSTCSEQSYICLIYWRVAAKMFTDRCWLQTWHGSPANLKYTGKGWYASLF